MYGAMYVGKDITEIAEDLNVPELAQWEECQEEKAVVAKGSLKLSVPCLRGGWNKLYRFRKVKAGKNWRS